jgi:hypothetical protein
MKPPNPSNPSDPDARSEAGKAASDSQQARVLELETQNRHLQLMVSELLAKNHELRLIAAQSEELFSESPRISQVGRS